ncbi:MAG: DUF4105 domain-containing protein [Gammaproteobacteria bacterium]|nr:DUF4105 domain-containing protein [Gammaproteobacteria bacterium]MBQ0838233.1 DUF4105 domain-containing protein [Gammaproteobacteria bacterium]
MRQYNDGHRAKNLKILTFLSSIFLAIPSFAQTYVEQVQQKSIQRQLYTSPYWLALGHYVGVGDDNLAFESYADDQRFFLSDNGKYSPKDELQATIESIFDESNTGDSHAQCRFVARLKWLSDELDIEPNKLPKVNCDQYLLWRDAINAESVTLIFASHFVNSPSSMYGHTLLRVDPPKEVNSSQWLSYAVNFGANVNDGANFLSYAWKGLVGGYPGTFSMAPYYKKIKQYSSIENRGLWEYRLDLSVDEVKQLVAHLWELNGITFDYFFADENCSFRLLELLEIARPNIDLLSAFEYKAIPTDTVRVVREQQMITDVDYRASQLEKIKYIAASLSDENKSLAHQLAFNTQLLEGEHFQSASPDQQRNILYVAYNYLRFQQRKAYRDKDMAQRSHRLLLAINALGNADLSTIPRPFNPIGGHKTTSFTVAAGGEGGDEFIEGQWRMSYHDLVDPSPGYPPGLGIEMLGVTARLWRGGDTTLERLDIISINSFAGRDEFFKPTSWRINGGMERIYNAGGDQLVSHVSGGRGLSYEFGSNLLAYTLLTGRYEYNEMLAHNHQLGAGLALGFIASMDKLNTSLELSSLKLGNGAERYSFAVDLSYALGSNGALRLSLESAKEEHYEENNIKFGYRYFY